MGDFWHRLRGEFRGRIAGNAGDGFVDPAPFEIGGEMRNADSSVFERRPVLPDAIGDVHAGDEDESNAAVVVPDRYESDLGHVLRAVLEDVVGFAAKRHSAGSPLEPVPDPCPRFWLVPPAALPERLADDFSGHKAASFDAGAGGAEDYAVHIRMGGINALVVDRMSSSLLCRPRWIVASRWRLRSSASAVRASTRPSKCWLSSW